MIYNFRLIYNNYNFNHCYKSGLIFKPIKDTIFSVKVRHYQASLCQLCGRSPKHINYSSYIYLGRRPALNLHTFFKSFNKVNRYNSFSSNAAKGSGRKRNYQAKEMRKLLSLAKSEKWNLSGAIVLLLISSSITMAVPFALGKVIDLIFNSDPDKMKRNLNILAVTLFLIFLVGGAANFGRVYLINLSGQRITKLMREKVFNSIMRQEVGFFDKNKTGELINRLSADTTVVSQCITMNLSDGLRSAVMVVTALSMMFYLSVELAGVSLLIVPPIAIAAVVYGRFVRKISKNVQDALADSTQVAEERIANIRTVKSFGKEEHEMKLYRDYNDRVLMLANKEALARGAFFGMAGLSGNLVVLSVLYYGGVMVSGTVLTVGELSAFLLYAAYIGVSLGGLSSFYSEMNRGLGASKRLWEIIERNPAIPSLYKAKMELSDIVGNVKFEGVVFSYPTRRDHSVLRGVTLEVMKGKVTALVGPSGSGKSTLGALLLRLYDPDEGTLILDGRPLYEYDPHWITDNVGYVEQEPVLFSGSIKENITYGAHDPERVSQHKLDRVMDEANVTNFVKNLPQGLDTLVGERGILLSGGQKQRIAIARALIKDPKILLLDEATSALDAESERLVQEALERVMKGRTVLTIAHRLSTIKNADQIVVLDSGEIAEVGSYDELIHRENGVFKNLVKHQTFTTT